MSFCSQVLRFIRQTPKRLTPKTLWNRNIYIKNCNSLKYQFNSSPFGFIRSIWSYWDYLSFQRLRLFLPFPLIIAVSCECKCGAVTPESCLCGHKGSIFDQSNNTSPNVCDEISTNCAAEPSEDLSHKALMKQACQLTIDAVTRLLTQVVSAYDEYTLAYRRLVELMMELLEESRSCHPMKQEVIDLKLVIVRSRMDDARKNMTELETYISSVERLAYAASEAAFLAQAEYPSVAMSERVVSALAEIQRIKEDTKNIEKDMLELQAVVIVEQGKSLK